MPMPSIRPASVSSARLLDSVIVVAVTAVVVCATLATTLAGLAP